MSEPAAALKMCRRCQGNGEIVTDWDRYKHPLPGDVADEAVAECPDCDGEGTIASAPDGRADMAEKLLDCPFCGCGGQVFNDYWDTGDLDQFGCKECAVSFELAEEWNTRASPQPEAGAREIRAWEWRYKADGPDAPWRGPTAVQSTLKECETRPLFARQLEAGAQVTEERIAKTLAYMEWPLAPEEERIRWRDSHWQDEVYGWTARAILALLPQAGQSEAGWRPIESAPKNERVLIAWRHWRSREWLIESGIAFHDDGPGTRSWHSEATHWKPLPAPPNHPEVDRG